MRKAVGRVNEQAILGEDGELFFNAVEKLEHLELKGEVRFAIEVKAQLYVFAFGFFG